MTKKQENSPASDNRPSGKTEGAAAQSQAVSPRPIGFQDIGAAVGAGWRTFRLAPTVSMAYASVAALVGLVLLASMGHFGISPMALPFAGGFMLVGPAMLGGFFHVARTLEQGDRPGFAVPFSGFFRVPPAVWLVAVFCAFLFLIWITDAGVIYAFLIGGEQLSYELPWLVRPSGNVLTFWGWGSLMGSVLAFIIFAVSAFSVPLLFERRTTLVSAVHASVRAVFESFVPSMAWAVLLSVAIVSAIVLLPLLLVVLPVLAYASFSLYRAAFRFSDDG